MAMTPTPAGHAHLDHTGEMELRVDAPSLAGLFAEGAHALAEVLVRSRPLGELGPPERVRLAAHDLEALWVAWLNELVFMSEITGRVYWDVEVHACGADAANPGSLTEVRPSVVIEATVRGTPVAHVDTAVKAATYHRLALTQDERGWHADFILDV